MFITKRHLPRRTFLRGIGATVALPLLDAMSPAPLLAENGTPIESKTSDASASNLDAVASEIAERVRMLDGLVRYRFGDDPALMQGWASARDVLGPFRSKVQQEPEAGGSETPKAA